MNITEKGTQETKGSGWDTSVMCDSALKPSVTQLGKHNVSQHNVWSSAEKPWEAFNPQDSEPCSISSQDITQGI